jgi:hypothetical protein
MALAVALTLCGCGAPPTHKCTCPEGVACDQVTGVCLVPTPDGGPTGCVSDHACGGASPRCLLAEARCVACLTTADCNSGVCESYACLPVPDACPTARELNLTSGAATVHSDLLNARNDTTLSCSLPGSAGPDVVYKLTVPALSHFTAVVTPEPGSGLKPLVALRSVCDQPSTEAALGCAYASGSTDAAALSIDSLAPGTYFLWVEAESTPGPFTLSVRLEAPPVVDTCVGTTVLYPTPTAEVIGDTAGLNDDATGSCGVPATSDAVYALRLDNPRRLLVEVTGLNGFEPTVYLRTGCADASARAELACLAPNPDAATSFELARVEAGISWIYIDGSAATSSGRYALRVTTFDPIPPATNDTCATAQPLVLPAGNVGTITVLGDTSAANNDLGGCGNLGQGPDVVYTLTLPVQSQVLARVTPIIGSRFQPSVSLRDLAACDLASTPTQRACAPATQPGYPAAFDLPLVPAGSYALWVDGMGVSSGAYTLTVELSPPPTPPANDTCSAPQLVSLSGGSATVTGTTLGAADDQASCEILSSPDVVYTLDVPARQSVSLDVQAASGSALLPVVSLQQAGTCAASIGLVAACGFNDGQASDRAVLLLPDVPQGQYSVWVNGDFGSQGPFTLRAASGPVIGIPQNDGCAGGLVPEITAGVAQAGDTRGATNDPAAACGITANGLSGIDARDVVFTFTVATARPVTVTVTPDGADGALFRPLISVRGPASGCSLSGAPLGCIAAPGYGRPVSLSLNTLAPGTYTLLVDGAAVSAGKFTVTLQ